MYKFFVRYVQAFLTVYRLPISQRHKHRQLSSRFPRPVSTAGGKERKGVSGVVEAEIGSPIPAKDGIRFVLRSRARDLLREPQGRRNASPRPHGPNAKGERIRQGRPAAHIFHFFHADFFFPFSIAPARTKIIGLRWKLR